MMLVAALAGCGSAATQVGRVGRERLLQTADPRLDPYFLAVYGHQRALGDIDARRAERGAALAVTLGLRQDADRATLSAGLRGALDRARVRRVRVRLEAAPDLELRVDAWQRALSTPSPQGSADAIAARYAAVVSAITVTLTPVALAADAEGGAAEGGAAERADPASLRPALAALAALLGDAEATRRCVTRLVGRTPAVFAQGAALRAAAPARWWAEFEAAERFVIGVHARATLHEQESVRALRWALGTLQPEAEGGEAEADEGDDSPPEIGPDGGPR
jgi:hypothetical protein